MKKHFYLLFAAFLISVAFLIASCVHKSSTTVSQSSTPVTVPRAALSWENTTQAHPERAPWSDSLLALVAANLADFSQASDVTIFCPNIRQLSQAQQSMAIAELVIADIYYESGYDPTSRMQETTMGQDPLTHLPVFSEGLLQLSYQDQEWAPFCKFDWPHDKLLSPTDPKKTILDPYINLACGVKIMSNQVKNKGSFTTQSNYWSTLKNNGKYSKVNEIINRVKANVKECQ